MWLQQTNRKEKTTDTSPLWGRLRLQIGSRVNPSLEVWAGGSRHFFLSLLRPMPRAAAGFRAREVATRLGQARSCWPPHWPPHRLGFPALVSPVEEDSLSCFRQQQSCLFLSQGNMGFGKPFLSDWGVHQEGKLCRCTSKPADLTSHLSKRSRRLCCLPVTFYLAFKSHVKQNI